MNVAIGVVSKDGELFPKVVFVIMESRLTTKSRETSGAKE